jgi:lysylphosphatidylglycerol synthetase-like protein (DUF2156 family)
MIGAAAALAARASAWSPTAPPGDAAEIERLRLLHGRTHMSCFAGSGHKSCLTSQAGAVSYQVRWGVAVAAGDPLAQEADRAGAAGAFLALCTVRRWVPCFFQTDASLRGLYRDLGLRVFKFGEEAVVDILEFDLRAPASADARHDVARARRAGLESATLPGPPPSDPFWAEAALVSTAWLSRRGRRGIGFSLGRLGEAVDTETWYTVARDREGRLHAFCSWVRVGEAGIALDLNRWRPDATHGAVDLCVVAAIEAARALGLRWVSLGAVAFRESLGDAPDGRLVRRARAGLYRRGRRDYSYRGLSHFKAKVGTGLGALDTDGQQKLLRLLVREVRVIKDVAVVRTVLPTGQGGDGQLCTPGRDVVLDPPTQDDSAWRFPQRWLSPERRSPVHRRVERPQEALRLDEDLRRDSRQGHTESYFSRAATSRGWFQPVIATG